MARTGQTLNAPSKAQPVASKKRVGSETTKSERPKKRVKINVQPKLAAGAVLDVSVAGASQSGPAAPIPASQDTQKKPRGRPKKTVNLDTKPIAQTTVAPSSVPPAAVPPTETAKKKGKGKDKKSIGLPQLKWKIVPRQPPASSKAKKAKPSQPSQSTIPLKPRIWTATRQELLATMPEMTGSKAINGMSWELYETPILLLDEKNVGVFGVRKEGLDDYSLDLVTIRSFVGLQPMETIAQEPEVPPQAITKAEPSQTSLVEHQSASASLTKLPPKIRRAPRYNLPQGEKAAFIAHPVDENLKTDFSSEAEDEGPVRRINFAAPSLPMHFISSSGAEVDFGDPMDVDPSAADGFGTFSQASDVGTQEKMVKKKGKQKAVATRTSARRAGAKSAASASAPANDHQVQSQYRDDTTSMLPPIFPTSTHSTATSSYSAASYPTATISQFPPYHLHAHNVAPYSNPSYHPSLPVHTPSSLKRNFSNATSVSSLLDKAEAVLLSQYQLQGPGVPPPHETWYYQMQNWNIKAEDTSSADPSYLTMDCGMDVDLDSDGPSQAFSRSPYSKKVDRPVRYPESTLSSMLATNPSTSFRAPAHRPKSNDISTAAREIMSSLSQQQSSHQAPLPLADAQSHPSTSTESDALLTHPANNVISSTMPAEPSQKDVIMGSKTSQDLLNDYIPSPIPEELQTLVDSYLFGRPITIIISRDLLKENWALEVPKEAGYVMMGYFRILGIQETRIHTEEDTMPSDGLSSSGRVEWRFRLRWAPGGEEFIMPNVNPDDLQDPWWKPPKPLSLPSSESPVVSPGTSITSQPFKFSEEPEDHVLTTEKYRRARLAHHEYQFRDCPLRDLYESLIPTYLLAPFGKRVRDLSFPQGWLCMSCGKLNFQRALRHRYCTSTACKGKATVQPYALSLFTMRDPQDRLPVSFPYNRCPAILEPDIENFVGGMRTITYNLRDDVSPGPYIKHVFTGNIPTLQAGANKLLESIQLGVELVRGYGDSSPFFSYTVSCPQDFGGSSTNGDWKNVPPAVIEARQFIVDQAKGFASIPDALLSINQVEMMSWVTAGSRRSSDVFHAKKSPVMILILGCEVELTLYLKSLVVLPTKKSAGDKKEYDPWYSVSAFMPAAPLPLEDEVEPEEEVLPFTLDASSSTIKEVKKSPKKAKASKKDTNSTFTLSLFHGDMAVVFGDDFNYSIKREGTSILVIASHEISD